MNQDATSHALAALDAADALLSRIQSYAAPPALSAAIGPDDVQKLQAAAIRAAAAAIAHSRLSRAKGCSQEQADAFVVALGTGLTVRDAAELAGTNTRSLYRRRKVNQDFAADWDAALEAGASQVLARLRAIALYGDPGSMSTIRAAEISVRTAVRSERKDLALTLSQRDDEGNERAIKVTLNTPSPD